jgi:hyperosmotically inducible protein
MKFGALLSIGLLAAAVACGPNKPDYEDQANKALSNAGLTDVDSNYDSDANVVHLTGTVATDAERERAEDVVQQAVAPGAMVANEVTVANVGTPNNAGAMDSNISDALDQQVKNDPTLKDADVDFDVNNGVVTITGQVPTADAKQRVGDMARNQTGVRDVVNSAEVKRPDTKR